MRRQLGLSVSMEELAARLRENTTVCVNRDSKEANVLKVGPYLIAHLTLYPQIGMSSTLTT